MAVAGLAGVLSLAHPVAEKESMTKHRRQCSVYVSKILATADAGSVIARDHAFGILVKLGALDQYAKQCFPLLREQLLGCPSNQFPMYAEMSLGGATAKNKQALIEIMDSNAES